MFKLKQNYPNPFNPETIISYSISQNEFVKLIVYDVTGREAAVLVNGNKSPGSYSVTFNASELPSGIYFYKLITGTSNETKTMVLVK